jgi:hypothetical protein
VQTIRKKDLAIKELEAKKPKEFDTPGDGRIVHIPPHNDICYINLGRRDGVLEDITFMVFPAEGKAAKDFKGSIQVVDVRETFSISKITGGVAGVGDKIANMAYDKSRTFRFVIIGDFDLTGSSAPTASGRIQVKEAIRLAGSKVEDKLDVQTDFLVVGFRPQKPIPPSDDAPATAKKAYEQAMMEYVNYDKFQEQANELNVVKIDTDKFLTFTGYIPKKIAK